VKQTLLRTSLLVLLGTSFLGFEARTRANSGTLALTATLATQVVGLPGAPIAFLTPPPEGEAEENKGESRELIFKTINFIILAGGLAYLLRKPLSEFFSQRSSDIRKSLEEGRKALAESQARLSVVENKLKHLEEEIASFKATAARDMEAERERRRQAVAAEVEKMLAAARTRIETTAQTAKLDLTTYVAEEAMRQAEEMIRGKLDDATRRQLVSQFVTKLEAKRSSN
jgi:F0F1-type ATP synthase membrane subunit b/b'